MNSDFWIKKWQEGDIRFHQIKYHSALEKFGSKFSTGTILVPLCGKSLDMLYLSSIGHRVVGAELSPIACRDFFDENGLTYTLNQEKEFAIYESENITLWCGDFFKLPQSVWNEITGIYDRAALIALPQEVRAKYASEIITRGSKKMEILLVTFEYPDGFIQGPPFSVTDKEIHQIYDGLKIQMLSSEKEEKYTKDHPKLKSVELTESVYWLTA